MIPVEHRGAALEYLREGREAVRNSDYPQASEKLWGATAEMVKAVAEARGWPHNGHYQLFSVINCLADETGDSELPTLFRAASALHTNFYEWWLPPGDVERAAEEVNRLLQKLEGFLEVSV
jgi:hypothetical protein